MGSIQQDGGTASPNQARFWKSLQALAAMTVSMATKGGSRARIVLSIVGIVPSIVGIVPSIVGIVPSIVGIVLSIVGAGAGEVRRAV